MCLFSGRLIRFSVYHAWWGQESGQQRQGDELCDPYIHEGYSSSSSYSDSVIKPATDGITQQEPQKHY